jgi:hypothetical protein
MAFPFFKKHYLFLLFLFGCQKPLSLPSIKQKNSNLLWSVIESYRPPTFSEGPLQRVLTLHGNDVDQVYVDRQEEDDENWIQIGLTNEKGSFVDRDIEKNVRYRFGGKLITPWYEPLKTTIVGVDTAFPAKIKGIYCLVPADVTLFIQDQTIELNCKYVNILGNIYSFKNNAIKDREGLNAGKVRIIAEEINIQGKIWLLGQNGGSGKSVSKGMYHLGYAGKHGGAGGEIFLQYQNIQEMYESFRVDGGKRGRAGFGAQVEKASDALEGLRGLVIRKKKEYRSSL